MESSTKIFAPPMTWSIFVPNHGAVSRSSARLSFAQNVTEVAFWKTSKGAHDAIFRGKEAAVGAERKSWWDLAIVDETSRVKKMHIDFEAEQIKAFNQHQAAVAAARFAQVEAGWKVRGVSVTFENAGGEVTTHYGQHDVGCASATDHTASCNCTKTGSVSRHPNLVELVKD
jgi:hypothetical protein